MFFQFIRQNSKRSRRENGLFFVSLLVSIVAFYIILSLPQQDVMLFLKQMESDAVNRLLSLIPVFYGFSLCILFFLIYYASKFELDRRRHEFGVLQMMGMRRGKLFALLLAEDAGSSILALMIGLPTGLLLSELISLITARCVGLGIIGHSFTFSLQAVYGTAIGFFLIKFTAFLILSGKIAGQEIGSLLSAPVQKTKKQIPLRIYVCALLAGILFLAAAYQMAIDGRAWIGIAEMGTALGFGLLGTFLFFFGFRIILSFWIRHGRHNQPLAIFNIRQLTETVMNRSNSLAVSSLLLLASLCCFGAGIAIAYFYSGSEPHTLDYTFSEDAAYVQDALASQKLDFAFADLFEIKTGYIRTTTDYENAFAMDTVIEALSKCPPSKERDILLSDLNYTSYPHLIALSGYNRLLSMADLPTLDLHTGEAAVYMDHDFATEEKQTLFNLILSQKPETNLDGETLRLTGNVQTTSLVTDRSITLSFALIVPDEAFDYYTKGDYDAYINGILDDEYTQGKSLLSAISDMNQKLNQTRLVYESYLQNMGRQLFYVVAASYITLYLALIFSIIANTVIGVQFLMGQHTSGRRYQTLIRLGADYPSLCQSAKKQINWHFGFPTAVAAVSSLFGVQSLFTGLLSSRVQNSLTEMTWVAAAMIIAVCMIEWCYMAAVKRSSSRYLLTLMKPNREE